MDPATSKDAYTNFFDQRFEKTREYLIFMEETKIWQQLLDKCSLKAGPYAKTKCRAIYDIVQERTKYYNSKYQKQLRPQSTPGIPPKFEKSMSVIHYKFKSLKDFDSYTFEGAGVPVWELKQEIINIKKLNRANDFDLILANAQTNQEYSDDMTIIPKNSSIIVRRVPAAPGRRFMQPRVLHAPSAFMHGMRPPSAAGATSGLGDEETSRIASMLDEASSHWTHNQQMPSQSQFSANRRLVRPKGPVIPPPTNYICFRCGQRGHFISNCPTNTDPNFNRPKIRKTTGIPKTFLKPVERGEGDTTLPTGNVLLTAEGNLVIAEPNESVWSKLAGAARNFSTVDDTLPAQYRCPICTRILFDPVYLSCCPKINYCDECIRSVFLRSESAHKSFSCRNCRQPVSMGDVHGNPALAGEINDFFATPASGHKRTTANDEHLEIPESSKKARLS